MSSGTQTVISGQGYPAAALALLLLSALPGCEGRVDLSVYGEGFVEDGIPAREVSDGWQITFDELLLSITDVGLEGDARIDLEGGFVVDLARPSGGRGHPLAGVATGGDRFTALRYRFAAPAGALEGNASDEQRARMVEEGAALWVRGAATRGMQTVRFDWGFPLDQGHLCAVGLRTRRDEARAEITIHADHLFLDDPVVDPVLAFDLVASADSDGDGTVTTTELAAVDITGLPRYQTGDDDVADLYTYVGRLALTMGHVDGEGTCAPQFVPRRYRDLYGGEVETAAPAQGASLYTTHCASCHGDEGRGDGPAGESLRPRPTDLTRLSPGAQAPEYIHFRVAEGGAFFPYASTMPALAMVLDDAEIAALVVHVRSFAGAD